MRRTAWMHINPGAGLARTRGFGKSPGRPRVIEVDVTEENVANVSGVQTDRAHCFNDIFKG